MKKFIFFFPFIVIIILLSFISLVLIIKLNNEDNIKQLKSVLIGKPYPKTNLVSLFQSNNLILDKEPNEPFVVNFFASWCIPCKVEAPYLENLSSKIKIYGIAYKDRQKDILSFIKEYGNPYYNIGIDKKGFSAIDWGVYGVPETFIINSKGIVIFRQAGPITESILKKIIDPKLKELAL